MNVWSCKIGEIDLPEGNHDKLMRQAVCVAYYNLTGEEPKFIFSGWGDKLTELERAEVEGREPDLWIQIKAKQRELEVLLNEAQKRLAAIT